MISIKFFARLRETLGCAELDWQAATNMTVAELLNNLAAQGDKWQILLEQDVLCAVNQLLVDKQVKLQSGDEVAFFPPVTGG